MITQQNVEFNKAKLVYKPNNWIPKLHYVQKTLIALSLYKMEFRSGFLLQNFLFNCRIHHIF